jgi:glucose-6-phosphate isomerase
MALNTINPTNTASWKSCHFDDMQNATMQEMFQVDVTRTAKFHLKWNDFLIDYSKNIINQDNGPLLELANELGQKRRFRIILKGKSLIKLKIEQCCTLHTSKKESAVVYVNGKI